MSANVRQRCDERVHTWTPGHIDRTPHSVSKAAMDLLKLTWSIHGNARFYRERTPPKAHRKLTAPHLAPSCFCGTGSPHSQSPSLT